MGRMCCRPRLFLFGQVLELPLKDQRRLYHLRLSGGCRRDHRQLHHVLLLQASGRTKLTMLAFLRGVAVRSSTNVRVQIRSISTDNWLSALWLSSTTTTGRRLPNHVDQRRRSVSASSHHWGRLVGLAEGGQGYRSPRTSSRSSCFWRAANRSSSPRWTVALAPCRRRSRPPATGRFSYTATR